MKERQKVRDRFILMAIGLLARRALQGEKGYEKILKGRIEERTPKKKQKNPKQKQGSRMAIGVAYIYFLKDCSYQRSRKAEGSPTGERCEIRNC